MKQIIKKDEFYLIEGPAEIKVTEGSIEVIAAEVKCGKSVKVPVGKKIPVMALENSSLEIEAKENAVSKMEGSSIPAEWDILEIGRASCRERV